MSPLKIVFAGTPEFAASHLRSIAESKHLLIAVYTQPDRPSGRGKKLLPSPVKVEAIKQSIPVFQPANLRSDSAINELAALEPDLMVVVAYGLILPEAVLEIPKYGCINVHASLLPKWRGAAPIERALLAGDEKTGVTIMQMDAGLDTGDMLAKVQIPILLTDTRISLEDKLANAGAKALVQVLDHLSEVQKMAISQLDSDSSYASKISKDEALINWKHDAASIHRQIRAGIGRYPAFSFIDGVRVRFLDASLSGRSIKGPPGSVHELTADGIKIVCGDGILSVHSIQLPGKNPVSIGDLLNSNQQLIKPDKQFICSDLIN